MAAFTQKAIIETFLNILAKKPLDKITVTEVITECGINRSTFYYYFEDIYSLLNKVFEIETAKIIDTHTIYNSWTEAVVGAMAFASENKSAIYHIHQSKAREKLEKYVRDVISSVMYETVERGAALCDSDIPKADKVLVTRFYLYIVNGLIIDWIDAGMVEEPVYILDKLAFMLENNISQMLDKAVEYDEKIRQKD